MTTVTGKFQITLPKRLVDAYGISVGDEVDLLPAGETIAIVPARAKRSVLPPEERLRLFDDATRRQKAREGARKFPVSPAQDRGWTREELYTRGRSR
jgi:AbrB family looped-hinge helix DNA binding protein